VADAKSLTRGADKACISLAAASTRIKQMEEAVGGKLTKGVATGYGDNSAVAVVAYRGVPTYVAFWQRNNFEAIVWRRPLADILHADPTRLPMMHSQENLLIVTARLARRINNQEAIHSRCDRQILQS
jgi:hypothetical protein